MKLENVGIIKSLGFTYNVEYIEEQEGMAGLDGKIETSWLTLKIRKNLPADRISVTIWHEVLHHISHYMGVRDDGKDLSESEISRLATALHDFEIVKLKEPEKCEK